MNINDDGGRAFPRILPEIKVSPARALEIINEHAGMSLRDYFAAAIAPVLVDGAGGDWPQREIGITAYRVADDLLRARNR